MPARPRTAAKAAAGLTVAPAKQEKKPTGTFARLKAEADERRGTTPQPYVIEDVDPPIEIPVPDNTESQIALAEMFSNDGDFQIRDARRILELTCGPAFPRVWELVRAEHITVLMALIDDMGRHFGEQADLIGAEDFPGGSAASSA